MNKDIIFEDLGYDPTEWDLLIERQRTLVAKHKKNPEILKVYFQDHWRDKLRRFLGEARADRYVAGEELIARTGLFTPEILGFGRARGLSYVKMQYIDGVELISVIQWLSENEYGQILNEILKQFGELVGILHKAGLVHGDLRAGNVLCKIQKNTIQQVLIDHDRSRKVGFKKHEQLRNLMQLSMVERNVFTYERIDQIFDGYNVHMNYSNEQLNSLKKQAINWGESRKNLDRIRTLPEKHCLWCEENLKPILRDIQIQIQKGV